MISESEKIVREEFKELMKIRDFDAALDLVINNPIPFWKLKAAHELVRRGNNLKMIDYFASNYGYKEDFHHMFWCTHNNFMELISYAEHHGYILTDEDVYRTLRNGIDDEDNEAILWSVDELKERGAMSLVKDALGWARLYRKQYSYEFISFLVKNLDVENRSEDEKEIVVTINDAGEETISFPKRTSYDDLIWSLFKYKDIRYTQLLYIAKEKGYDFDFKRHGSTYLSDILFDTFDFSNCDGSIDTRLQKIEILKDLGWTEDKYTCNQFCNALLRTETYSKDLLLYYDKQYDVNRVINEYGDTLLIRALKGGNNIIAQKIIDYGADVNAGKRRGY